MLAAVICSASPSSCAKGDGGPGDPYDFLILTRAPRLDLCPLKLLDAAQFASPPSPFRGARPTCSYETSWSGGISGQEPRLFSHRPFALMQKYLSAHNGCYCLVMLPRPRRSLVIYGKSLSEDFPGGTVSDPVDAHACGGVSLHIRVKTFPSFPLCEHGEMVILVLRSFPVRKIEDRA